MSPRAEQPAPAARTVGGVEWRRAAARARADYEEPYLNDTEASKFVFGAFAATWTPQASCVDCPLVRVYARFDVVYEL